ncbi:MAG: XRE family transcriptional regulator [Planktotalea sp.]|jgi:transcriptional regulator with XRE-family HTH domain|uniref:helix-turn-helix domain-containing protein n=1 Tax=Planktotalea sp. TaxID=2029877 RepID=UPI000183ADBC|nr:XRE family transcriptional regulator [Planktotalea sp.]EDZ42058.1 transcriptional regulator, XRE family with cupin sensor domain [Rhodobacteraceae bacterium HTCC2083]MBT5823299.1 helix-turn-helix domain-containing protein [Paracoccaceae bacterium]MDG1076540.1 XRE family transcriptional regulator [Planktotalea sp.]MDG1083985.1 XRE family transcriptional regulator [Planktotalea sp.]HCW83810.1 XRE family transcriptional regulator [Paracoccaceae bacterium]
MTKNDPSSTAKRLGAEIREVRKARGLTLNDLSDQLSCSTAYLSRIELGSARISGALLQEIGKALHVDPEWFAPVQSGEGPLERHHIVRAENRRKLSDMYTRGEEEMGFCDELLSSTLSGDCYLILSRFAASKGAPPGPLEGYIFEGEQHAIVITGEVELRLGDEVIVLREGDSFSYPSMIAHRFRNRTDKEATMVWAMSPVRISW